MGLNALPEVRGVNIANFLIQDLLDENPFSYSKIGCYEQCPHKFILQYIEKQPRRKLFFSSYGSFLHQILEKYDKGELELFELADYYKNNYKIQITEKAPPNQYKDLNISYYNDGLYFFENFQGYEDKTIGVEQKVNFETMVGNRKIKFIGIIDRIAEDENGIILYDHKSKKGFKNKKEKEKYFRQLYIYAHSIKDLYGKYPYKLRFNMVRDFKIVEEIFSQEKMNEAMEWLSENINSIYDNEKYEHFYDEFFCNWLCDIQSGICPYREKL